MLWLHNPSNALHRPAQKTNVPRNISVQPATRRRRLDTLLNVRLSVLTVARMHIPGKWNMKKAEMLPTTETTLPISGASTATNATRAAQVKVTNRNTPSEEDIGLPSILSSSSRIALRAQKVNTPEVTQTFTATATRANVTMILGIATSSARKDFRISPWVLSKNVK
mmetsp:Transcript_83402/g.165539  ORF Transcript_83402/g.165539 Transcript_83402/m.165539 type:complete len:167 (-) Transcript_83402:208-708(-)